MELHEFVLDEPALEAWGRRVGAEVRPPVFLCLRGGLGAGKSVLARAVARGAGVIGTLPSPTYNLLFRYPGSEGRVVVHMDLYRLEDPDELAALGWEELGASGEVVLVEWPERAGDGLPEDRWEVTLDPPHPGSPLRRVEVRAVGRPAAIPLPELQDHDPGSPPRELVLAVETSTPRGGVALGWGDQLVGEVALPDQQRHAATLLPAIRDLLEAADLRLGALAGVVVGAGPGSFTGVRVAAATARGLVRGAGLPLLPVSSLAGAAAIPLELDPSPLLVCFDARGDRLFVGGYRGEGGGVVEFLPPVATRIGELLDSPLPAGVRFSGDGAWRHRALLEEVGFPVLEPPLGLPSPAGLIRLATSRVRGFLLPPHAAPGEWEPDYQKDGRPVVQGA